MIKREEAEEGLKVVERSFAAYFRSSGRSVFDCVHLQGDALVFIEVTARDLPSDLVWVIMMLNKLE